MKISHKYIQKLASKIGHGQSKVYVDIIMALGKRDSWKPLDKNKIAKNSKVSIKKVNKAIRRLKKANIIRYRAGKVRYAPQLLSQKGVLINKVQGHQKTRKKRKRTKIKQGFKHIFSFHKHK